ncbi:hypothetical protein KJK34_13840 [Flavobacterium sp. D11R37]|uniref:hypothetical protein n=1 Tax=Flavobacterium coralii TaxID=2838017 RepID=UPI001CA6608E|nr:hypothetical protein [Flavobacterium coralii]MBY8963838.1 hypothetical protein [Flavobacterium coralii]
MKQMLFLIVCLTIFACSTEDNVSNETTQSSELFLKSNPSNLNLSENPDFILFVQNFVNEYLSYAYYQQSALGSNQQNFQVQISNPDLSFTEVEQVYTNNNVDFELILDHQTMITDLVYQVYISYPEFDNMTEEAANEIILSEIGDVLQSGQVTITNPIPDSTLEITPDEIWYCIVEAVGIGIGSTIGMKQLKKNGVKVITKALTKTLAKFAGPIGVAITIADFGFCIYRADRD